MRWSNFTNVVHCESCEETFFDNGVDLVQASDHIEDGPDEVWCIHCLDNWKDHQTKHHGDG